MATLSVQATHPNIAIMVGSDVHSDPAFWIKVRDTVFAATSGPVRKGTHHFLIVHSAPAVGGGGHWGDDISVTPLPFCGVAEIGGVPDLNNLTTLAGHVSTMLQEVGHYWLVPEDLLFDNGGDVTSLLKDWQITQEINEGSVFSDAPLLARANVHWSAYFDASGSPMDGQCWLNYPKQDGYDVWKTSTHCGIIVDPGSGLPPVDSDTFNDLELQIMGVLQPFEAYGGSPNGIKWIEPRLTAPLDYHAGVSVIFGRNDQWSFGFDRDHNRISVRDSDGTTWGTHIISPDYHPLASKYNFMAFRVVRRGDDYYFQARVENIMTGCLIWLANLLGFKSPVYKDFWDALDPALLPTGAADFRDWKTIATRSRKDAPAAIGVTVNKYSAPFFLETAFRGLGVKTDRESWLLNTEALPGAISTGDYGSLQDRLLNSERHAKALFATDEGNIHIKTPYGSAGTGTLSLYNPEDFAHDKTNDNSPKLLTKAPAGDFAFGSFCVIRRGIFTPWAGGWAQNRTMWGQVKTANPAHVVLTPARVAKQAAPANDTYKFAFILMAKDQADVTTDALDRLETLRSYWDEAFELATQGRRFSDSTL